MPSNLIQFEIDALNLRAELQDLALAIEAMPGDTSEAKAQVGEAILFAGKLADGLADAQEARG